MRPFAIRLSGLCLPILLAALACAATAGAAELTYQASLSGPNEAPPNASTGTGMSQVDINTTTHMMHVYVYFTDLISPNTNCHIHAPTAVAGTGTAGVATTLPTFAGFPSGVFRADYSNVLDLTLASSWNPAYVTANGGTTAGAESALLAAIAAGKAYVNVHSQQFPGGEIRGFLSDVTVPVSTSSWGRIKSLYR